MRASLITVRTVLSDMLSSSAICLVDFPDAESCRIFVFLSSLSLLAVGVQMLFIVRIDFPVFSAIS